MGESKRLPSVEKPWQKYYTKEALETPMPECTMYRCVYERSKEYPKSIAFNYFGKKITYGEFFDSIDEYAAAFYKMGLREGDVVTFLSLHTPETIVAMYALNKLGVVLNMCYITLPPMEIVEMCTDSRSKALIVLENVVENAAQVKDKLPDKVIVLSPEDSMPFMVKTGYQRKKKKVEIPKEFMTLSAFLKTYKSNYEAPEAPYHKGALAVIEYTSGTTGDPKGVMLSNDNLNSVSHQYDMMHMMHDKSDSFLAALPPFVAIGLGINLHLPLSLGLTVILHIILDAESIAKAFQKYKPNHFIYTVEVAKEIIKNFKGDMSFVYTFGGGGVSPSIEDEKYINDFLKSHGSEARYINGYGLSEISAPASTTFNNIYKHGTLGIPLPKVNAKIVKEGTNEELSYNEEGEICFSAPNIMIGYYRQRSETDNRVWEEEDGTRWLNTGDIASIDEDGFIHFVGRMKRIFMVKDQDGFFAKLYPMRIEALLNDYPIIDESAAVVLPSEECGFYPITFVTLKEKNNNRAETEKKILEHAKQYLPYYNCPRTVTVIDEMPHTVNGKIDYKKLEADYLESK